MNLWVSRVVPLLVLPGLIHIAAFNFRVSWAEDPNGVTYISCNWQDMITLLYNPLSLRTYALLLANGVWQRRWDSHFLN